MLICAVQPKSKSEISRYYGETQGSEWNLQGLGIEHNFEHEVCLSGYTASTLFFFCFS